MRRTGWRKTPDLTDKLDWKYASEPQVITWSVKAIDRNVWMWTIAFSIPFLCMGAAAFYSIETGQLDLLVADIVLALFIGFIYSKLNFEKTVFVYRATEDHLEFYRWPDIPDMVFTFLKVGPFIIFGIILMSVITNPALSIAALVGPALVGILIASAGSGLGYKAIYKNVVHAELSWEEVKEAMLDTHHGLIRLTWPYVMPPEFAAEVKNSEQFDTQGGVLYFRKDQQDEVVALVKGKLPAVVKLEDGRFEYDLPYS